MSTPKFDRTELEKLLPALRPKLHRYCARMAGSMAPTFGNWSSSGHYRQPIAALARRPPTLVLVLPDYFTQPLGIWVVMREDLAQVPRIRATFDHLVAALTEYSAE